MSDEGETWEELIERPDKRFVNEIPLVGRYWLLENAEPAMPETDIQALMEAAPNDPPKTSKEAQRFQRENVATIVANELTEEEQAVIETTIYAGHSIRKAAGILGWHRNKVHRLQQSALAKVKSLIEKETA